MQQGRLRVSRSRPDDDLPVCSGRLCLRKQTFALGALAGQLAGTANRFGLLASLALGRLLEVVATLHFAKEAFALHLLLERFQRLIDVVIADHDLNYLKLSIGFPCRRRGNQS